MLNAFQKFALYWFFTCGVSFLLAASDILENAASTGEWGLGREALVSLVLATAVASVRTLVAYLPILDADENIGLSKETFRRKSA